MIMKYTVVLEPQAEGGFTVQYVEIPGAISEGETREEALANIKKRSGWFSLSNRKQGWMIPSRNRETAMNAIRWSGLCHHPQPLLR